MKHEAIRELRDLTKLPDQQLRSQLLEEWVERWIEEVEFTRSVVNTKYLTSEFDDIIKTSLAADLAEDLSEKCTTYKTTDRKISASIVAFRRKAL